MTVHVYTAGDSVTLLLNGKQVASLGAGWRWPATIISNGLLPLTTAPYKFALALADQVDVARVPDKPTNHGYGTFPRAPLKPSAAAWAGEEATIGAPIPDSPR